jgi:uncharacterized membrane protein YozB (DUF420 family)
LELTLNFIWLGISCALLIAGVPLVRKQGMARKRLIAAMALVCVLCLLFPVISMTDDLHNTPAVVENKKLKTLVAAGHIFTAVISWFSLPVQLEPVAVAGRNHQGQSIPAWPIFTLDLSRRPPPLSSACFV